MDSSNITTIYSFLIFLFTWSSSFNSSLLLQEALATCSFLLPHYALSPFHIDINFEYTHHDVSFKLDQSTETLHIHHWRISTNVWPLFLLVVLSDALDIDSPTLRGASCKQAIRWDAALEYGTSSTPVAGIYVFCIRYFHLFPFNQAIAGTRVQFTACCLASCRGKSCQLQSHLISKRVLSNLHPLPQKADSRNSHLPFQADRVLDLVQAYLLLLFRDTLSCDSCPPATHIDRANSPRQKQLTSNNVAICLSQQARSIQWHISWHSRAG